MALDDLAFLSSSLTILVRASYLMLESTLSSVTTFYQVPCGLYGFQLTLHASIPSRQGPVPAGGLHVPGGRQSFCTYWGNEFAFLPSALLFLPVVCLADLHDMYSEVLSANPVPLPMGMFMLFKSMLKVSLFYYLCRFFAADGTTRLVVAVTQHVVLMVEWLLLPLVVSSCFKIAFELSSAVLNL